jgi:hypothetical protein
MRSAWCGQEFDIRWPADMTQSADPTSGEWELVARMPVRLFGKSVIPIGLGVVSPADVLAESPDIQSSESDLVSALSSAYKDPTHPVNQLLLSRVNGQYRSSVREPMSDGKAAAVHRGSVMGIVSGRVLVVDVVPAARGYSAGDRWNRYEEGFQLHTVVVGKLTIETIGPAVLASNWRSLPTLEQVLPDPVPWPSADAERLTDLEGREVCLPLRLDEWELDPDHPNTQGRWGLRWTSTESRLVVRDASDPTGFNGIRWTFSRPGIVHYLTRSWRLPLGTGLVWKLDAPRGRSRPLDLQPSTEAGVGAWFPEDPVCNVVSPWPRLVMKIVRAERRGNMVTFDVENVRSEE